LLNSQFFGHKIPMKMKCLGVIFYGKRKV